MTDISLSVYKFDISNRSGGFYNLTSIPQNDFIDKLESYFTKIGMREQDNNSGKALRGKIILDKKVVIKEERKYYKYLYFSVKYGDYGTESSIAEMDTDKEVFKQLPNHINGRTYHIILAMPYGDNIKNGVIIFENIGTSGVKTIVTAQLRKFAKVLDEDVTFHVNPITQTEALKKLITNNKIKKLKLIRYYNPEDRADKSYSRKELIYFHPTFVNLPKIICGMLNTKNLSNSTITEVDSFEPNDVKITLDINGKERTIGVSNFDSLGFTESIAEDPNLEMTSGNLPTDKSLKPIMIEMLESYIEQVNIS